MPRRNSNAGPRSGGSGGRLIYLEQELRQRWRERKQRDRQQRQEREQVATQRRIDALRNGWRTAA